MLPAAFSFQIAILFFIGIAALVILGIVRERRRQQQRTADLSVIAAQLGFAFSGPLDKELPKSLGSLSLFTHGHSRYARNVMSGQADETEVLIFDYRYTVSSGKHSHTHSQTVMLLRWSAADLPAFSLQPEGLFDKIAQKLGFGDIDFESHAGFSKAYKLKSQNEPAVRAVFEDDVLAFYESQPGMSTEACAGGMVFYRADRIVAPQDIQAFYQDGWTAYALLRKLPAPTAGA
jgi:hypothetical protein